MRSSISAGSITRLGMVGCVVRDQTVSAVTVIPGVLAIFLNGGACLLGEAASVAGRFYSRDALTSATTRCSSSPARSPRD